MPMTSPVASASGLPCSLVRRRANSPTLASMASAILVTSLRRSLIGVAAHAGKAALAAATAASSWPFEARGHRGIEDGHGLVAGNRFSVDEKVEIVHWLALPFERTSLEVSLYLCVYHVLVRRTTASAALQPAENRAGRHQRQRYILYNITHPGA